MSNIYALEPHTNAKVILHTTKGDIEIELWGKEAPRASRNFIQLCLEGYYDGTIFHRIVPDFLVQGGDPTGTGQGGESIYEDGFPDEFHSRLRFNRRGLVGLANTGQDDNGSQFFITLDRADELTKKHTLFGRVAGDTLFNVMKMTDMEVDDNERPRYPPKIKRTEVVLNPFDDIIPRISERERQHTKMLEEQKKKKQEEEMKKRNKKSGKKQLNLLSFGEEAEEMEPVEKQEKTKMKSKYDFMENQTPLPDELTQPFEKQPQEKPLNKTQESDKPPATELDAIKEKLKKKKKEEEQATPVKKPESKLDAIAKLKQDIRNISKVQEPEVVETKKEKKKSFVELEREKYANQTKKKKSRSDKVDDTDIFNKLMSFQKKLSSAGPEKADTNKQEKPVCKLHDIPGCESCHDTTLNPDDDVSDQGWISHKLVFDKDLKGKDLMQRKETVDDYVVIDPREREAKVKQEEYEKKKSQKSKVGPAFRKRERDHDYSSRKRR